MRREIIMGLSVSCFVLVLGFGAMELLLRATSERPQLSNERNTLYRYDSELGWWPKPFFKGTYSYEPGRSVRVEHNAMGFRDREHGPKRGRVLAVLGDSYVYGFNVEREERFTDLLQRKRPDWDIYNLGVSGFGTDQEYLLIQKLFGVIHPDRVLVIFCQNDHLDNASNRRYGYYKPYFDIRRGRLELRGVPVPKSLLYYPTVFPWLFKSVVVARIVEILWRPIAKTYWPTVDVPDPTGPLLLRLRDEIQSRGAQFAIGFIGYGPDEKTFCRASHLTCFETDSAHVFNTPSGHWNPQGHQDVARQVDRYLR